MLLLLLPGDNMKVKPISIYLDADCLTFLKGKVENGYKMASYLRYLIHEAIKREEDKDGSK